MRVVIATGLYPPEIGGPATYTKLLEDRLPEAGIEVRVVAFRDVRHLPKVVRHVFYIFKLVGALRGADVLFVQDTLSVGLPSRFAAGITRKPYLVRVPGDYAWEQATQRFGVSDSLEDFQRKRYGVVVEVMRALQAWVARHAQGVIAPSEYLRGIVREWGVNDARMSVIYNGVDTHSEGEGEAREKNVILTVGRLVPWKGVDGLIDVVSQNEAWKLVVIGEGPERALLERQVHDKKMQDRVMFVGQLENREVRRWMARASVFVLNSRYEGLSHTLIEACVEGVPIVATNVGGNPEVVRDGLEGILIPAGSTVALRDALARLLNDDVLREGMGEHGRARAQVFSIGKTVEQTGTLLKKYEASHH